MLSNGHEGEFYVIWVLSQFLKSVLHTYIKSHPKCLESNVGEMTSSKRWNGLGRTEITKSSAFAIQLGCFFLYFYFYFVFSRTAPVAYGGSQARGLTGAVATGLHHSHSNSGSEICVWPSHSSRQCQILNPLSEARGRTHNLMVPSRIR